MTILRIHKGDKKNTRNSKKKFKNTVDRKSKTYNNVSFLLGSKRGKFHKVKKSIKFSAEIETFLYSNYRIIENTKNLVIKLDDKFCLFNDPANVMLKLLLLLKNAKTLNIHPKIVFKGHVSFGAIYLIDNLCWEVGKNRKWVLHFDKFPEEERSIMKNIRSAVNHTFEDRNEHIINSKVIINRDENPSSNQQYRVKATDITNMVQKAIGISLNQESYELPLEIHGAIKSAIGEQFDNIHLHALDTNFGTICGFYNKNKQEVTLLVYNFGQTIAETFTRDDLPMEMQEDLLRYLKNHTSKKTINFTKSGEFTGENALTLLAIQEGMSSRIKYDISRGHGLMDFMEECFKLNSETRVSIISGKTAIKIDKKYPIKVENVLGRDRRIIALNEKNDIFEKPDPKYIRNTGINFNGVIIETTIPLHNFINE